MRHAGFECTGGEMSGMTDGDLIAIKAQFIAITSNAPCRIILHTQPIIIIGINLAGTLQVQPQFVSIVRRIVEASANGVDTRLGWTWIATGTVFYHALGCIAVKQAAAQLQPQAILYQRAGSIESEVLRVAGVAIFLEGGVYRH